jgi:HEAT repeat protein
MEEVARAKSQSAVPALLKLFGSMDSDKDTRFASARALVEIGSSTNEVRRALQSALKNDEDRGIRTIAARGLGTLRFEARQVMPALIAALEDNDGNVIAAAAECITRFKQEASAAIPALLQLLKSPATRHVQITLDFFAVRPVRYDAIAALREVVGKDERVEQALQSLLEKETDDEVRAMAAWTLYGLKKDSRLAVLHLRQALKSRSVSARLLALEALSDLGTEASGAVDDIIKLLGYKDALTRRFAAEALGRIGKPAARAVPLLREDPDEEVRSAAKAALDRNVRLPRE